MAGAVLEGAADELEGLVDVILSLVDAYEGVHASFLNLLSGLPTTPSLRAVVTSVRPVSLPSAPRVMVSE